MLKSHHDMFSRSLLSFLLIVLFAATGLAQQTASKSSKTQLTNSAPSDVEGWQDTHWGMSIADIKKLFSKYDTQQDVQSAEALKATKLVCTTTCGIINYNVAGEKLIVFLTIDDKTNGLKEINISDATLDSGMSKPLLFDKLQELLILKYGAFKYKEDEDLGGLYYHSRQWVFPSTIIELKQRYMSKDLTGLTQIIFKPANTSDANKL